MTAVPISQDSTNMWSITQDYTIYTARCAGIEKNSTAVEQAFIELENAITEHPEQDWLIDLAEITTVSSIAVARLIAIVRRVDMNAGSIAMINVHAFVSSVLTTMRIVKVLSLFEDENEALIFLRKRRLEKSE